MAFLKNIPIVSDFMSLGQGQMLGNFQQMNTTMGIDHYAFDDITADIGKHKDCKFVAGTKPELVNTDIGLFSKLVTYALTNPSGTESVNELFYETTSGLERQISGRVVNDTTGECPLFGGLGLKWGSYSFGSPSFNTPEMTINYINASVVPDLRLRNFTTTYAVIASIDFDVYQTKSTNIYTKNLSSTGFTIGRTKGTPTGQSPGIFLVVSGKWMAIGKE